MDQTATLDFFTAVEALSTAKPSMHFVHTNKEVKAPVPKGLSAGMKQDVYINVLQRAASTGMAQQAFAALAQHRATSLMGLLYDVVARGKLHGIAGSLAHSADLSAIRHPVVAISRAAHAPI